MGRQSECSDHRGSEAASRTRDGISIGDPSDDRVIRSYPQSDGSVGIESGHISGMAGARVALAFERLGLHAGQRSLCKDDQSK